MPRLWPNLNFTWGWLKNSQPSRDGNIIRYHQINMPHSLLISANNISLAMLRLSSASLIDLFRFGWTLICKYQFVLEVNYFSRALYSDTVINSAFKSSSPKAKAAIKEQCPFPRPEPHSSFFISLHSRLLFSLCLTERKQKTVNEGKKWTVHSRKGAWYYEYKWGCTIHLNCAIFITVGMWH